MACTVCKREIDKLVDLTHYTPDQCTITLGCEGRLQPLEYRSSGGIAVAPEVGVTDWRPRGSTSATTKVIAESQLIGLETGTRKQLVIGVPADTAFQYIHLIVKADTPKAYRQYVFRKEGSFTTVSGVENGLEKKALRFAAYGANPDVVEVFVNGVKLEVGTDPEDYQVYDGTDSSSAPPNTILFNTSLESAGSTQVDVIVSKAASSSTVELKFVRNIADESRNSLGSWENVSYVDRLIDSSWARYYLYTLDIGNANLPLNSIMVPETLDAFFLMARKPYTQLDRYTDAVVLLQDLSPERDYIKYYAENTVTTARVTSTAITTIWPPLRVGKFVVEKTIKTATSGVEEQLVLDGKVIVGPDA